VAGSSYESALVRRIITCLKYNYVGDLAQVVAKMMLQGLYFHGMFLEEEWVLVSVPLHRKRLLERGFNQAELFCQHLKKATGFSYQPILSRVCFTPPQAELSRQDRLINLKNVFVCQGGREIKNKKVLLVDDVLTTGTTLNECARVLKQSGVKEVWGLVGARG
jgi:ComF family protein